MRKLMNAFHWENVLFALYALCAVAALVLISYDKYMMGAFK